MRQMLYAGVDAQAKTTHITAVDETGVVVRRKQINGSPRELHEVLARLSHPIKAVLESSYTWGLMFDWLTEVADGVVLAHPAKVRAIASAGIKTDKLKSLTLAQLLHADLIPEAYAPSKESRAIKRVLRQRMFFVPMQTMMKNRIHALVSQHMLTRPNVTDLYGQAGLRWLASIWCSQSPIDAY